MTRRFLESSTALWILLCAAFIIRILGIYYGLPLTVVADEPPFVLGALQMLQLHTLIPSLHEAAFRSVLYYPPYLCYLYLVPFVGVLAVEWMIWHGSTVPFALHAIADLSPFFIIARIFSVAAGVAAIYLLYEIAQKLFRSPSAALASSFLLATSVLHMSLSMTGRHWIWVSLFFLLVAYVLTREISHERKIFWSLIIIGIGMGISTFILFALILPVLWFLFEERPSIRLVCASKKIWFAGALFIVLAALPTLLYHNSSNYLFGALSLSHKSVLTFFMSPIAALMLEVWSEPVLIALFLVGLAIMYMCDRKHFYFLGSFFLAYIFVFYSVTNIEPRFILPLVPFYALAGGYAVHILSNRSAARAILALLLLIPLAVALRFSYLAWQSDTRTQARDYTLATLPPDDRVVVYGELLRLPSDAESVREVHDIDPSAVRQTDTGSAALNTHHPHALSLYAVTNDSFYQTLPQYAAAHHYTYVLFEPQFATSTRKAAFDALLVHATPVRTWVGSDSLTIAGSSFTAPFWHFFTTQSFGPTVILYRLE